jgi:hypothetical protein
MLLNDRSAVRRAWIGWLVLFLATAAIIASGSSRTVVPAYREGAVSWMAGETIFKHPGVGGFVYLPQAAVLFLPLALLPAAAGEVVWRLFNIGVYALGILQFARLARGPSGRELFPLMTLVTLPLAWDCARNGQATLIITGLMLLAVADIAASRWWRATLWLALAVAFKPLAIVLVLLVMTVDRPMTGRVLVGMLAIALVPFLTQRPEYVAEQYAAFWSSLTKAAHVGAVEKGWTSPFNALQLAGIVVPEKVQTLLRLAGAFGTLALCFLARRRHDPARSGVLVFSLAALYLMLFSPRTENNTYAMLAPAVAAALAGAFLREQRYGEGVLLSCAAAALAGSRQIERLLTPHAATSWVSPLMAVLFCGYLVLKVLGKGTTNGEDGRPGAASGNRPVRSSGPAAGII